MSSVDENIIAKVDDQNVGMTELFRFTSARDRWLVAMSLALSFLHGATMPMAFVMVDRIFKAMHLPNDDGTIPPTRGPHENRDRAAWEIARIYLGLAAIALAARAGAIALCTWSFDRTVFQVKKAFFSRLLQQGPAWHDMNNSAEMSSRLAQDAFLFREGAGEHMVNTVRAVALFWTAILASFWKDWQITLVMAVVLPIATLALATAIAVLQSLGGARGELYISAGAIAEGAIQTIRTVAAFNGQRRTLQVYREKLMQAEAQGVIMGVVQGFCIGAVMGVVSFAMSIGFYAGSSWVLSGYEAQCWASAPPFGTCRTGGSILSTMFTVLWGFTMGLGTMAVGMDAISAARAAAGRLYEVIDEPLLIDVSGTVVLEYVVGEISYESVCFAYPGRAMTQALDDVSFHVPAGTTAAFVGPSGSGKSSLVSLLLRFYEPQGGAIKLDGFDIRDMKVAWLRSIMAIVEQEPVLFGCSIGDNIAYGCDKDTGRSSIEKAAKMANAHIFISHLPAGYMTEVGERGARLSGGQKQRIAIARALIRNPKVLLLDEATSALDAESERVVMDVLDNVLRAKMMTTLVIAHRLTTVQAADKIFVLQQGRIVESGAPAELLADANSVYSALARCAPDDKGPAAAAASSAPPSDVVQNNEEVAPHDAPADVVAAHVLAPPSGAQALLERAAASKGGGGVGFAGGRSDQGCSDQGGSQHREKDLNRTSLLRLWAMSRPEYGLYVLGCVATLVVAGVGPLLFMNLTQTIVLFDNPPVVLDLATGIWEPAFDADVLASSACMVCLTMLVVGACSIVATTVQQWALHKAGERFTTRLRVAALESILRQDMTWFDLTTSGTLVHTLAVDVPAVKGLVGFGLAPLLQSTLLISTSISLAMYFAWRFALSILAICPLMAVGQMSMASAMGRTADFASAGLVSEAINSVKTVAAFCLQDRLVGRFEHLHKEAAPDETYARLMAGLGTGLSSAGMFLIYACTVMFGTQFIDGGTVSPDRAVLSLFMLVSASSGIAEFARWVDQSTDGRAAANRVFALLDTRPGVDALDAGAGGRPSKVVGKLEFREVHFRYPARPDFEVYRALSLTVGAGDFVALVGPSGGGKSTIVSLLLRFYDPHSGSIELDGRNLADLSVPWLRSQIGLVDQEPVLAGGTVIDAICYGCQDPSEGLAVKAAKMANAHDFIMSLPDQYNTDIGFARHIRLSGGQKQRLAIARALARSPRLLLLDEATSALDGESERIVHGALQSLLSTRQCTTIVIAHRLSTIRAADSICVMDGGCIVEEGRHEELVERPDGHYAKLVQRQLGVVAHASCSENEL